METVEKLSLLIESWEDKMARMMAQRDFHIMGKDFEKSSIDGEKIETLNECIEELKKTL